MQMSRFLLILFLITLGIVSGCGGGGGGTTEGVSVTITPIKVTLAPGGCYQFTATINGSTNNNVTWSVPEGSGSVTETGLYTAPSAAGTYYVKATSVADPAKSAQATVTVVSGSLSTNKYTGTITIENTGTEGDLIVNQSASLVVSLVQENCPDLTFTQFGLSDPSSPAQVTTSINDRQTGGDDVVTIAGSLSNASMSSPQLVVLLHIKETTYNLYIGGVPVNCNFSGSGFSITQLYYVIGRANNEHSLPVDKSHITGAIQLPAEGLSGITQKITWDLQANF